VLQSDNAHCGFIKAYNLLFEDSNKHKDFLATDENIKKNFLNAYKNFQPILSKAKQKRPGIEKEFLGITKSYLLSRRRDYLLMIKL